MTAVSEAEKAKFFEQVDQASRKAVWCALASVECGAPRVRLVHPTWEGDVRWFATAPGSPRVELSKMFGSQDERVWRR